MSKFKIQLTFAVFTIFTALPASAAELVAIGAFDGNKVTYNGISKSTHIVASDCRVQVIQGNYGVLVFSIFCDGSPAPRVTIGYQDNAGTCFIQNEIDSDYSINSCDSNLWRVIRD